MVSFHLALTLCEETKQKMLKVIVAAAMNCNDLPNDYIG